MIESRFDEETRSIISCSRAINSVDKWWINRINVPPEHRGKRIASRMLSETCKEADEQGITLRLHVSPDASGTGLNFEELAAFYERYGFYQTFAYEDGDLTRLPQTADEARECSRASSRFTRSATAAEI